jgi:hypothetical protein
VARTGQHRPRRLPGRLRSSRPELAELRFPPAAIPLQNEQTFGIARLAHVHERRSRYVMIAGRGCRTISADLIERLVSVLLRGAVQTRELCTSGSPSTL